MTNLLAGLGSLASISQNIEMMLTLSVMSIILMIAILIIVIILLIKVGALKSSNANQSTIKGNTISTNQKSSDVLAKTRYNRRIIVK